METILKADITNIARKEFVDWDALAKKTFLITGATGLIGYTLVRALLYSVDSVNLVIITRDVERAKEKFKDCDNGRIIFVHSSIEDLDSIPNNIDYIIHGAANTSSKEFITKPVECFKTIVTGTERILELSKEHNVKSIVFLSSMEAYGFPSYGHKVSENDASQLVSTEIRNSYPISKMAAESLCCSYFSEYGIPAKIIRLTQTFGPGVHYEDKRVFAEFARCAVEKKKIVLKTEGKTKRSYLYTADAVTAILTVLTKGSSGEIYNAANERTFCSISQMAEMVAQHYGLSVDYDIQDSKSIGYANELYMDLDTTKLRELGWEVDEQSSSLISMYIKMIDWMRDSKTEQN